MPSKSKIKVQKEASRGCYVFKINNTRDWTVYIEGEFSPRGPMTKRQAKNLAYAISVSKQIKLIVTFGESV